MSGLTLDDLEVPSIVPQNFIEQHSVKPLYPLIQTQLSDVGVVITDQYSKIRYINRAFTRITGYNFKEVKGKKPSILQSGYHDISFYQNMWHSIVRTGQWKGEILDRRKDGSIYLESLHIIIMKNDKEEVTGYVGIITDITECQAIESQTHHIEELRNQLYAVVMAKGHIDAEAIRLSQRLDKVLNHYHSQTQVPYRKT